ncbi:two-component system, OmpR family, phosphate regulon sensor histidine kinase PhoR [Psychroflexus salarius]|uniref:histidine kinase n=1 Tax=Psychroflexus salarius TaxID=1155689 RepID=A0A1M4WJJ7_9FLAO|nr:ATP-binding protein [Psychroflexus salarius]SHE81408.1 two-component system, OmpR family, phosphate regulon sensor histidine kinase PhoR [Psychroflexus salarius]
MAQKFKRSYRFAFYTSTYITLFLSLLILIYEYTVLSINWGSIGVFALSSFVFSFFIIQLRIEYFIYKRVKAVYDSVSLLDAETIGTKRVTSDMKTLTAEVEKFARDKKLEIETLKVRENYRKEFIGNISHELKTPLFTVQGYILTLLDGAIKDKKVRKKYLARASKGVDRLIYIVKDLDMITKLETGDLHLFKEDFDVVELIQSVFELLEMKAAKKDISLTFDAEYEPIHVNADMERIQQVLTNLIVNSIKYGKKDGTTEISLEFLKSNKLLIRITDNGEGIEKQHISRLFERFFRVDKSGSRKEGGSGLGLSIVKHIIEAHQEQVFVDSEYGIGSEFSFTLPLSNLDQSEVD